MDRVWRKDGSSALFISGGDLDQTLLSTSKFMEYFRCLRDMLEVPSTMCELMGRAIRPPWRVEPTHIDQDFEVGR